MTVLTTNTEKEISKPIKKNGAEGFTKYDHNGYFPCLFRAATVRLGASRLNYQSGKYIASFEKSEDSLQSFGDASRTRHERNESRGNRALQTGSKDPLLDPTNI